MLVSLVLPAFNEALRLPPFLAELVDQLLAMEQPVLEIVVADDGSRASEAAAEREAVVAARRRLEAAGSPHRVRFFGETTHAGKGGVIRAAWAGTTPEIEWLGFVDSDGAVGASEVCRLARRLSSTPCDVVAGSRIRMAGRRIERSLGRHLQGRLFATLVDVILDLGFYDTQCGLKFFKAATLRPVLGYASETRWLLDVELLALLKHAGASAIEVPIDWRDPGGSKVVPGLDALRMMMGLRRIARRLADQAATRRIDTRVDALDVGRPGRDSAPGRSGGPSGSVAQH